MQLVLIGSLRINSTLVVRVASSALLYIMNVNSKLTRTIETRVVRQINQEGFSLHVVFTDGSVLQIKLEDPASSVMVRGAAGQLEYAD
jgi:hypothetical protein